MNSFVVTGTDTGIGKTVCAAMLTLALDSYYWKPIQSGIDDGTDRAKVAHLAHLPADRLLPEAYVLREPQAPERAAAAEGIVIDIRKLSPPMRRPLIIEGAGGLMVPITPQALFIDVFKDWKIPVVLCARTTLGTMNHTLLSVEALKHRDIPLRGIIFIGPPEPETVKIIATHSGAKILGHLPLLPEISRTSLQKAFTDNFNKKDFI